MYNASLTTKEIGNICLVTYMYICFMSTRSDYTEYQVKESEIIIRKLELLVYNPIKGIPWIVLTWPEI